MVRPVYLRVAVHAALPEQELGRHSGRQAVSILRNTWMAGLRVTALTK